MRSRLKNVFGMSKRQNRNHFEVDPQTIYRCQASTDTAPPRAVTLGAAEARRTDDGKNGPKCGPYVEKNVTNSMTLETPVHRFLARLYVTHCSTSMIHTVIMLVTAPEGVTIIRASKSAPTLMHVPGAYSRRNLPGVFVPGRFLSNKQKRVCFSCSFGTYRLAIL